jgi:hypothetical protein
MTQRLAFDHFYQSPLGFWSSFFILQKIQGFWPSIAADKTLAGVGLTTPFLQYYASKDFRPINVTLPCHGLSYAAAFEQCAAVVSEESLLCLASESVDYLLIIHGLEFFSQTRDTFREIWRVLKPQGRILVITPNRRGLWSHAESTPFGQGQPYSMTQLQTILKDNLLIPVRTQRCLYMPPVQSKLALKFSPYIEKFGSLCLQKFSGLVLVEAVKELYAPSQKMGYRFKKLSPTLLAIKKRAAHQNL